MYYRGGSSSSYRAPGFEFRGNEITGPFQYGIYVDRLTAAVIEDNAVTMRATSWSSSYTLELSEVEGATRVVGNRLFGARQYGLNMQFCNAVEGSPALVANNMIGSSSGGQTVFLYYNTHVNFYHNSVLNTATGEAIQYNGTASAGNRIQNNIFRANTGQAVYVSNSTGLVELDYNDLVRHPLASVKRIYDSFALASWSQAEAPLQARIARASSYRADPVRLTEAAEQRLQQLLERP